MDKELKAHIEYLLCVKVAEIRPISGGDISEGYLLETETERFFCKINKSAQAFEMFQSEKSGLEAISKTKTISTPAVLLCEKLEKGSFLLMEYIEPKNATSREMELFGHQLAGLHQFSSSETFGWNINNFIGSLPQSNNSHYDWPSFYVEERLLPQLKMACDLQRLSKDEISSEEQLFKTCDNLFSDTNPSLLHGDLWSGNYLISKNGSPYLIDPAVYFGHHEVDIAMSKLFGGFDASFYDAYSEHFPKLEGEKERNEIYQLYYLLVHQNLFGNSYKPSVTQILKRYF